VSIDLFAKTTPVNPPTVNKKIKPRDHSTPGTRCTRDPCIVANQEKTLIPVGIAIIMVAEVKYARESTSIPTVNMWCAHTINPRALIETMA
jgi:hypothetical protein